MARARRRAGRRATAERSLRRPAWVEPLRERGGAALTTASALVAPIGRRLRPAWATVTPIGKAVMAVGLVAWVLAWRLGWDEMAVLAALCLLLLGIAALFMLGSTNIAVTMSVEPPRVTVGEAVAGDIEVTNKARTPLLPVLLELPVGAGGVGFDLPALLPNARHSEIFVVPTERRGVIEVGPVTTARGDALGLFRRDVTWSEVTEIFVHPKVTPLEPLGAGLMRDLEGHAAENISMSDLAFHALREYVPGDDLRHVHWRSSAKHGQLLVRQFLDTRRSHLNTVVDAQLAMYSSEDDYELAISVAGSLLVRAILDGFDATFLSGDHAMTRGTGKAALDACSRAEPGPQSLVEVAAKGNRLAPDTSVVFLITGPETDFLTLQRAAAQFPIEVGKVAIRIDGGAAPALRSAGELPLLTLGRLADLPVLLKWGLSR